MRDGTWTFSVDGLRGVHSQAKRLDQVDATARDLIFLLTDEPEDSFTVDVLKRMPQELEDVLARYLATSREEAQAQQRVGGRPPGCRGAPNARWPNGEGCGDRHGSLPQRVSQVMKKSAERKQRVA